MTVSVHHVKLAYTGKDTSEFVNAAGDKSNLLLMSRT